MKQKGRDDIVMTSKVQLYQCMINLIKSHQDWLRNYQVISVNMLFLSEISEPESLWWCHRNLWGSSLLIMINQIKSHQNRMRNDRVISINMLFSSKISGPERLWWCHHDVWGSSLSLHDKWSSYKCKHAIFVRNKNKKTPCIVIIICGVHLY